MSLGIAKSFIRDTQDIIDSGVVGDDPVKVLGSVFASRDKPGRSIEFEGRNFLVIYSFPEGNPTHCLLGRLPKGYS